jgi:hypothetical protein
MRRTSRRLGRALARNNLLALTPRSTIRGPAETEATFGKRAQRATGGKGPPRLLLSPVAGVRRRVPLRGTYLDVHDNAIRTSTRPHGNSHPEPVQTTIPSCP